jgi:exonuclease III
MDIQHNQNLKECKVLCHNIRGINSEVKWNAIRNKIQEIGCDIVCLQETKREHIDLNYIKKFCPRAFDKFCYLPSVGSSGGTIIIWKGSMLDGELLMENEYAQSVEFMLKLNGQKWILTNIYAPSTPEGKMVFLRWFREIYLPDDQMWIIVGDFNLIRNPDNRNKPGGDINLMIAFNEALSKLGVIEIPMHGQSFTWSNMKHNPLLKKLDWVFVSQSWSLQFPGTEIRTLSWDISDHVPYCIIIKTDVPKAQVFRFKNFWLQHNNFQAVFKEAWEAPVHKSDPALILTAKLKAARKHLKYWQKSLP